MAPRRQAKITAQALQGFKYLQRLEPLLQRLHPLGTERDHAGNRRFFCDDCVRLVLLYFFSPTLTSLRGLQQASDLDVVQQRLGVRRVSRGSLSECTRVFDPEPIQELVRELAAQALPLTDDATAQALTGLVAVDGSVLRALPRMAWALWTGNGQQAARLHLHFDVFKGVPERATVTVAASSEVAQLQDTVQPGRLYVVDRGYYCYRLYRAILDAQSSFIARVKESTAFTVAEERALAAEAKAAGVERDVVVGRLGSDHHKDELKQPVRLVLASVPKRDGTTQTLWLATDRLDLPAELVLLAYRYRWTVELFFRWLKCLLGCRHWLWEDQEGLTLQVYVALLASVLVVLWTEKKLTKRTWEMLQWHLLGVASDNELARHLAGLPLYQGRQKRRG